jgi:hypothetical protein
MYEVKPRQTAAQHTQYMLLLEAALNFGMAFVTGFWPATFDVFTIDSNLMEIGLVIVWTLIGVYCVAAAFWLKPAHARAAIFASTIPLLFILGLVVAETVLRIVNYGDHATRPALNLIWYIPIGSIVVAQRWMALRFSRFAPKDVPIPEATVIQTVISIPHGTKKVVVSPIIEVLDPAEVVIAPVIKPRGEK